MANVAKYFLGLWIAVCTAGAFLYLQPVPMFVNEEMTRMLAFHLPNAMVVIVAAIGSGWFGFRFLQTRNIDFDAKSQTAARLATRRVLVANSAPVARPSAAQSRSHSSLVWTATTSAPSRQAKGR